MDYLGIGNNYRMPPMNALLGISQFIRLEEILLKKEKIHNLYKRYLSNNFKMQKEESGVVSNKWLNVIQTDSEENKNKLIKKLRENNVEARGTYKSANLLPWFEYLNIKSPVSEHIYRTTISLPSGLLISEEQIKKICSIILN